MTRALVAGAGIVGLTTALTLRHAGIDVTVAERAPRVRALGTSLGLWRNALAVFDAVDIGDEIRSIGRPNTMYFHDAAGRSFTPEHSEADDHTLLLVDRSQFAKTLAGAVGSDRIRLASGVTHYVETPTEVKVDFADGTNDEYDLLIGADGINSTVRQQLLPGTSAVAHAGHHNWRAVVTGIADVDRDVMTIGHDRCRGGYARTRDGGVYWLVAQLGSPKLTASVKTEVLQRAAQLNDNGWNGQLIDVIRATPEEMIIHSPISIVPELPQWASRRVALVGDAAHAMSPHITAGATLGIEDAAVLARHLDADSGLAAYSANRIPRYRRAAQLSSAVADYRTTDEYAERYAAFSDWMIATGEGGSEQP